MSTLESLQKEINELKKQNERMSRVFREHVGGLTESRSELISVKKSVPSNIGFSPVIQPLPQSASVISSKQNLELNIGVKWFSWIGIAALVIGVGFFIKYAIDANLISYLVRIFLGVCFGISLIVGGELVARQKIYRQWGRGLVGGGLAIVYFSVYATYFFTQYREATGMTQGLDIFLLILAAATTVFFAVRDDSQIIASEAFLLGFITSLIGGELQIFTLIYNVILTGVLIGVVVYKKWPLIGVGGVVASYLLYALWQAGPSANITVASLFLCIYFFAFSFQSFFLTSGTDKDAPYAESANIIATLVNAGFFFYFLYTLLNVHLPGARGFLSIFLAIFFCILGFFAKKYKRERLAFAHHYLSIGFLGITIPIVFHGALITALWSVMGLVLVALWTRYAHRMFFYSAFGIWYVVFAKTLVYDVWHLAGFDMLHPFVSTRFVSVIFTCMCLATAYALLRYCRTQLESKKIGQLFCALTSSVLVSLLIPMEFLNYPLLIVIFWSLCSALFLTLSLRWRCDEFRYSGIGLSFILGIKILLFDSWLDQSDMFFAVTTRTVIFLCGALLFYGMSWYLNRIRTSLQQNTYFLIETYSTIGIIVASVLIMLELKDYWISMAWALVALLTLIIGFSQKRPPLRYQGIVLLGITICKVFLYDTRQLTTIYRTLSFMALGGILLATSFLYAKHKEAIKKIL